jgi:hypothetical protein
METHVLTSSVLSEPTMSTATPIASAIAFNAILVMFLYMFSGFLYSRHCERLAGSGGCDLLLGHCYI